MVSNAKLWVAKITGGEREKLQKRMDRETNSLLRFTLKNSKGEDVCGRWDYFDAHVLGENELLKPFHRVVLAILFRHAGYRDLYDGHKYLRSGQMVQMTINRIAEIGGLSSRAVSKAIQRLETLGCLKIVRKGGIFVASVYEFPVPPKEEQDDQEDEISPFEMSDTATGMFKNKMMETPFSPPWKDFNAFFDGGWIKKVSPSAALLYLYLYRHQRPRKKTDAILWAGRATICQTLLSRAQEWRALGELGENGFVTKGEGKLRVRGENQDFLILTSLAKNQADEMESEPEAQTTPTTVTTNDGQGEWKKEDAVPF